MLVSIVTAGSNICFDKAKQLSGWKLKVQVPNYYLRVYFLACIFRKTMGS